MKIAQILDEIDDMKRSVEPTRESITSWYDWLSVIRDEQEFVEVASCTSGFWTFSSGT